MLKVLTLVGTRPELIRLWSVISELDRQVVRISYCDFVRRTVWFDS